MSQPPAHAARLQVTVDCVDPHPLSRFWADALGYKMDTDHDLVRSLLDEGRVAADEVTEFEGNLVFVEGAACVDPSGGRPRLYFQRVPEEACGKNRWHLDIQLEPGTTPEERAAEVERLVGMGAQRVREGRQGPHSWVVMTDPEGNFFCAA